MSITFLTIGLIIFTICSGFLSGSETALFSLSSMKVRALQNDSDKKKRLIANLVSNPRDLMVTILMLNILANIMIQNFASNIFDAYPGWMLKVGIPLLVTLIFGEIVPKSLALRNNYLLAYFSAPIITSLRRVFGPLRIIIIFFTSHISRFFFFFLRKEEEISKKELQHLLKTSKKHGVLHADEAKLINGYLNLQDSLVKELMQPREDVFYYDITDPISRLPSLFVEQKYSRIPVCDGGLNNILGIISARQFLLHRHKLSEIADLKNLLRKPFYVPETTPAQRLFKQYEEKNEAMALVVDEYGAITGLITLEDLFEVVIGRIANHNTQQANYTQSSQDVIIASGKFELTQFEDIFGIPLESPNNMVTIGGWLTEQLGHIPKAGVQHTSDNFLFHVLAADPNRVRRIYIRSLHSPSTPQVHDD